MISLTLTSLAALLADHLKRTFKLNEDIVALQMLTNQEKNIPTNKLHLFLSNIERETSAGVKFNQQAVSDDYYKKGLPAWQLNLYVMIAAVFQEKQYEESLRLLSGAVLFLQSNNQFTLPQTNITLSIEPVSLSFTELSNIWGIYGGTYYPSILCKIRTLIIDANEIQIMQSVIYTKEEKL